MKNPIYSCLWFDGNAKEAAEFYLSVFKGSKIIAENPVVVMLEINQRKFMLLNGGPMYKPTAAVSFVVECETQDDIDHYWDSFTKEGEESMCGWCMDKFGFWWQVIPANLGAMMSDPERGQRVMNAFLKMKKFNIQVLEEV
jgi:predicted 3-demethylubiquinone-9 3-methyltransferase (glyoxalase superfamily)